MSHIGLCLGWPVLTPLSGSTAQMSDSYGGMRVNNQILNRMQITPITLQKQLPIFILNVSGLSIENVDGNADVSHQQK